MFPLKDENPTTHRPFVTLVLIAFNVAVFFLVQPAEFDAGTDFTFGMAAIPEEVISGEPLSTAEYCSVLSPTSNVFNSIAETGQLCSNPSSTEARFPNKNVYLALISSMFLHGGLMHLFGNMLYLWVFGNNIEDHLGRAKYLIFYVLAGIAATFAHIAADPDSVIPVIGASGAIAGVMGAYVVWFPWARIRTIVVVMLLNLRAWIVLAFWFGSQFFISANSGVAWLAHVGGFVFGAFIALLVRTNTGFRERLWSHKYLTQTGRHWDPRFGGTEDVERGHTPTWYAGP